MVGLWQEPQYFCTVLSSAAMATPRAPNLAGARDGVMARDSTGCVAATGAVDARPRAVVAEAARSGDVRTGSLASSDETIVAAAVTPDHAKRTFMPTTPRSARPLDACRAMRHHAYGRASSTCESCCGDTGAPRPGGRSPEWLQHIHKDWDLSARETSRAPWVLKITR